jgi:hypothetical protein
MRENVFRANKRYFATTVATVTEAVGKLSTKLLVHGTALLFWLVVVVVVVW